MTPSLTYAPDPQLLTQAIAACTVGVIMTDARQHDHPIVYVNPAFEALSGYAADEILGHNCRFLQGQDRDQPAVQEIRQAMAEQRSTTVTLRNYRKDGTLFYNELTLSPVHDASGTLTHYLGFQNDVTQQRQALKEQQAGLLAGQERFATIFEAAPMAIVVARVSDLHYIDVNPEFLRQSGYNREEIIGRTPLDLNVWVDPLELEDVGRTLQEQGKILNREVQFRLKSGAVADTIMSIVPVMLGGEACVVTLIRDITSEKRARQTLAESEARYRHVAAELQRTLDLSLDLITTTGPGATVISVNAACERILGYTPEELIGLSYLELVHPDDRITTYAEGVGLTQKGQVERQGMTVYQNRYLHKDGHTVWLEWNAAIVPGDPHIYCVARDITERHQAQEELRASEARHRPVAAELQRTLDLSQDLITTSGLGAEIISINAACGRILGYTPEEMIGRSHVDFVHPDDRTAIYAKGASMIQQGAREGPATTVVQNRYLHKDGHTVWIEWNAAVVHGNPLIYGVGRDITQRKAAEEDQAFLAAIVEASPNAIVGVELDGTIRSWNSAAEQLYGYTAAEGVGQSLNLIIPEELRAESAVRFSKVAHGEHIEPFESVRVSKDGRWIPVIVTVSPILDAAGQVMGMAKITRDISARLAADHEIKTLNEDLRQQLRHVTGLRAIDQSIASSASLTMTLSLVLDNLCEQLGADAATALVLNPDSLVLDYTAIRGFSSTNLQGSAVKVGVELAGQVTLSAQALHVPDLRTVPLTLDEHHLLQREGLRAYYAVPLIIKGKVVGVIEVLNRQTLPLSPLWLEMLGTVAGQAAIAVENAQLFTELERRNLELRLAYDETIEGWARALDLRDKETEGHSRRVTEMTVALCQQLGLSSEQLVQVRRGALLHDIGKMGIRDAVLLKPGKLTDEEWVEMKKHPTYAVELLSPIRFLRPALDIPEYHHEKWDGSGYPLGLKGEVIPLTARAFSVVDVYDALTSDRPYRAAWSRQRALEHIQSGAGTHFDPYVVQAFFQLLQQSTPASKMTE